MTRRAAVPLMPLLAAMLALAPVQSTWLLAPTCVAAEPQATAQVNTSAWRDRTRWPVRFGRVAADAVQGVVVEMPEDRGARVWRTISSRAAEALEKWDPERDGRAIGAGLDLSGVTFREVGPGGFGFVREAMEEDDRAEDPTSAAVMMFVSARELDAPGDTREIVLQRTWFALYDPTAAPARGIAVVMPGIFGTPEAVFDRVVRHFQTRGWVVLRMMAQPTGYTERLDVNVDPDSPDQAARTLASVFDERAAECAYAVEAALRWAAEKRPEVKQGKRVILGGSGGAMSLPPVVARSHDTFDAAVLIAGGADYATIAATSNYEDWVDSVHIRWNGGIGTPDQIRAFGDAYLRESILDSYHTAEALHGTPTLVLQASRDKAVPAPQQELLWERLGRPERRLLEMGHESLFISLPFRMGGIMDWLDAELANDPAPSPPQREDAVQNVDSPG